MIEISTKGFVSEKGQFTIHNKKQFTHDVVEAFMGQKVRLFVERDFVSVSHQMRKYYFGPLLGHLQDAFRDSGDHKTKKDLDIKMRRLFLVKDEIDPGTGEIITLPKSLSKEAAEVSNDDMKQYIDSIIRFCAEHLDYGIAYPVEY